MERLSRYRIRRYALLLASVFAGGAAGASLAFLLLFSGVPDALGTPQVRQQPFDWIVMSGLCIGAATGWAAAVLIRLTWRHVCAAMIPRRRWFRFSLRTLFVVITVLCLGLGWLWRERNLVMERRQLTVAVRHVRPGGIIRGWVSHPGQQDQIPFWRRWMGDRAFYRIRIRGAKGSDDWKEVVRLFPESQIWSDQFGLVSSPATQAYQP